MLLFWWLVPRPLGAVVQAQDVPTPVEIHHPLLLKILTFDRLMAERVGDEIVVGILHQPRVRASYTVKETFMQTAAASKHEQVKGIPIRFIPIELTDTKALPEIFAQQQLDVLYIAPLRTVTVNAIITLTRQHHILTFTGVPAYVNDGMAVGIDLLENKPKIVINLPAARAEGVAFNAHLLKLATVIQEQTP